MIQEGNHAACVDPSDATPVLKIPRPQPPDAGANMDYPSAPRPYRRRKKLVPWLFRIPNLWRKATSTWRRITVTAGTQFPFGEGLVTVWATPGHTDRHISYLLENSDGLHVFCGDTLFSAGCGRVFTGTIEQLYDSFHRFNQLPEETLFLSGARIHRLQSALCPAY